MSGTNRADIKKGVSVSIVLKQDQRSGTLTEGIVQDILTNSSHHPHGIKVRLESGAVGRVKVIHDQGLIYSAVISFVGAWRIADLLRDNFTYWALAEQNKTLARIECKGPLSNKVQYTFIGNICN